MILLFRVTANKKNDMYTVAAATAVATASSEQPHTKSKAWLPYFYVPISNNWKIKTAAVTTT